jgi:transcriptional regulator with XRE-family HTH domain
MLNIKNIEQKIEMLGLSQAEIAKSLDVTRETVSQWFKNNKFPRPGKLLKLAQLLKLTFNELVTKEDTSAEPVVAFRKKGRHNISDEYIEEAKDKGYLLNSLVQYLPFDNLSLPPSLKEPNLDYEYIQDAARATRKEICKSSDLKIEYSDLINFFNKHHAVLIPVFWGDKKNHENALHVFLPRSMTTWIYLNLDSKIHDFKFWMAHELGHVKSPDLKGDEAEDFADLFAGALLFNSELAQEEYIQLRRLTNEPSQLSRIMEVAENLIVSPLTVYYEINKYARHEGKPKINLETDKLIYKANTNFQLKYSTIANDLFSTLPATSKEYFTVTTEVFKSPFFRALKDYLIKERKSVGFVQTILNLSPVDAQTLYEDLFQWPAIS